MKTQFIIFLTLLLSFNVYSAEEKDDKKVEKKEYSEKEFHDEVLKRVELKLKKLRNGKIVDFSKELLEKEYQIKVKELGLKKREEEINNSQKDFQKQVQVFNSKQKKFLACIDETDAKEDKRIQHMVDVVSGMKPDSAAQVLSVQDSNIAVKILGMLDAVKVSKIFNKMDKEISARLQKQFMTMKK